MASSSDSPEVTFREKAAPTPTFDGLAIPAALKELRATGNQKRPSKPSDMTALATKLRSFHIDSPPDSDVVKAASAKRKEIIESQRHKDLGDKENFFSESRNDYILKGINLFHSPTSASEENGKQPLSDKTFDSTRTDSELRLQEDSTSTDLLPTPEDASEKPKFLKQVSTTTPSRRDYTETSNKARREKPESEGKKSNSAGDKNGKVVGNVEHTVFETSNVEADLHKILEGKDKWTWPHRKDALLSLAKAITTHPKEADRILAECISKFSMTMNDHLEELRPTVITSALGLIDAIILKRIPTASPFSKEVFPSVMDVACGRSLTAESAARTLVHMLNFDESLSVNLRDADNSERLMQHMNQLTESGDRDISETASTAMRFLRKEFPSCAPSPARPFSGPVGTPPGSSSGAGEISDSIASFRHGKLSARSTPNLGRRLASLRAKNSRTPSSRIPIESSEQMASLRRGNTSSASKHSDGLPLDSRTGTHVLKNMKLGDSVRKVNPQSARSGRLYTEEEVETIRRNSVRAAIDKVKASNAKESQKRARELDDMRQKLHREHAEVEDLRSVLEEFEMTMKKMVSEGNSKANAHQMILEKERNKLKAELLERSDAFEKLKERYENSKETIVVYENKESRFIEQIKELKRNMVELQKWSNDLKANSEKKLSKAFESVTAYRSSYIDKEAHANKALSDLKRTAAELEKSQQSHAETAAKFATVETQLHEEQDAKASAEAALATAKSSLTRVTSQKDQLQIQAAKAEEELSRLRTEITELKEKADRLSDVEKRLETYTNERQSLKARAYDDMMRIRDLEDQLDAKSKECDELNQICEEVMQQLEQNKTEER
ncbi:Spindle assembly checkpoint component Mad1 [Gracilaria domingensis]|nr:Spindle assembly checkpoint component Mad1 [Gracilaria domingensis]